MFCYYSVLVKLHKIVEVHFRLLDTNDFHLKAKNERFTAAGSWRYRQHLKYEKCTSLFGRVRHKLRQKAYRTCSNIIFPHSTNEIIYPWRCRYCRHFINSPSLTETFIPNVRALNASSLFILLCKPLFKNVLRPDYHPYNKDSLAVWLFIPVL